MAIYVDERDFRYNAFFFRQQLIMRMMVLMIVVMGVIYLERVA